MLKFFGSPAALLAVVGMLLSAAGGAGLLIRNYLIKVENRGGEKVIKAVDGVAGAAKEKNVRQSAKISIFDAKNAAKLSIGDADLTRIEGDARAVLKEQGDTKESIEWINKIK
jgi:hypothetical protein